MNRPAPVIRPRDLLRPLCAALFVALTLAGCGRPPSLTRNPSEHGPDSKSDPWQAAAKKLQKESEYQTCKLVLAGLTTELAATEKSDKPAGHTKESLDQVARLVPLNADDRSEIEGAAFTAHDPAYLASCLYLRDAVRSLSAPGLAPEKLADLGFAWVCRQVYLNPWLLQTTSDVVPTALPPVQVLRRGSGTALERMYVFLAFLQQAGLDGCLIGPARAGEVTAFSALGGDRKSILTGGPAQPFWAVGVRLGGDIKLYDPWRGEPFPASWNRLRASPETHRQWFEDRANLSRVKPEDIRSALVYLAVPVNALAPRMTLLELKLKDEVGVRLAIDPVALSGSFAEPRPAFWNPPGDRFAYGRTARMFLPPEEGGSDRTDRSAGRLYDSFMRSQIPGDDRVVPQELRQNKAVIEDIGERIGQFAKVGYVVAFLDPPPTPREQLQRGFFPDASRILVERQDQFSKSLERVRNFKDSDRQMREWAERATAVYDRLGRDPAARAGIDALWKEPAAALLLDRAIGEVGQSEASFLLALCKHEQAERIQARLERAGADDAARLKPEARAAWQAAIREWRGYREQYAAAQANLPGRAAHARVLAARAESLANQK